MFKETIDKTHASSSRAMGQTLSLFIGFIGLVLAFMTFPVKAHAQIVGNLEGTIPFPFYVGDTKLPAGQYILQMREDSPLTTMEITSEDGSISALFDVTELEANSAPAKAQLIFNKYGNSYFLAEVFDEGSASGEKLVESRYEEKFSKEAAEGEEHVDAHRRAPKS